MPSPINDEVVADVRRVLGSGVQLRRAWQGDKSIVFAVLASDRAVGYLKLSETLRAERERLEWLDGRLPVPQVLSAGAIASTEWLLLTPLPGLDLANLKHTETAGFVVGLLAQALHTIHATPTADCPFGDRSPESVLVHGDACLPNFLFSDGVLTGVLDVGDCGRGDLRADLATAVWSVQYNLGPGYATAFLDAYGIDLVANDLQLGIDEGGQECLRFIGEQVRN